MKLSLVIPVWKRPELTRHLLAWYQALSITGVSIDMVVVGSEGDVSRRLASGLEYFEAPNDLLDRKYDLGITRSQKFNPDAVCLVGSDDFITDRYFTWGLEQIRAGIDLVGLLDFYLADLPRRRVLYWGGYPDVRRGEPIGAGRIYSRRVLETIDWKPYWSPTGYTHVHRDDQRSLERVIQAGGQVRFVNMARIGCQYWAVKSGSELNPISEFEKQYPVVDLTAHCWGLFKRTVCYDFGRALA